MKLHEKKDLVWAMKSALLEQSSENRVITESKETSIKISKFIKEELTYEQLLNLCFNPNHKTKYLESSLMENIAIKNINFLLKEELNSNDKFQLLESIILKEDLKIDLDHATRNYKNQLNLWAKVQKRIKNFTSNADLKDSKDQASTISRNIDGFKNKIRIIVDKLKDKSNKLKEVISGKKLDAAVKKADFYKNSLILVAAGVAIGTASYFIYKRFFSMKAKACKNAENRKECLKKIKIGGYKEAIKALQKAKSNCSQDENPDKCKAKYDKQITKWKKKISK